MATDNKSWLVRKEYPFKSNYFDLPMGKMNYIDEGKGEPIVFVHGNPGWSYEYRKSITELSKTNRCISADNIGFGLSKSHLIGISSRSMRVSSWDVYFKRGFPAL